MRVQFCLQTLHSGRLVKDVLVLDDSDPVVAGHGCLPDVAALVPQHLVLNGLSLLVPTLVVYQGAKLDLDDAHLLLVLLILPVLPGGLLGAGEGLLGGGPVAYVCVQLVDPNIYCEIGI